MRRIEQLIRPELHALKPYSSARSDFKGSAEVFIDANENPFGNDINRYPDPLQRDLKAKIAELKGIDQEAIFLGNGSDEVLDLIFRLFCVPGKDAIVITPPTYGMYKVLAGINNVFTKEVPLDKGFQLDEETILKTYDRETKILFLCSPNNPVGISLERSSVERMIEMFPGIVVIDEAYIDFSKEESFMKEVLSKPNLIVTQTLSKAWGMAGIRLGMAFAHPFVVQQLNKIKPPYNVNILTQREALKQLQNESVFEEQLATISQEKQALTKTLEELPMVKKVYASDANFLLVKFDDAPSYYQQLLNDGIVVRNRSHEMHCENCLRITIGTPQENKRLIQSLMS